MNKQITLTFVMTSFLLMSPLHAAFADNQEKLDFVAGLEETLGHF